MAVRTREPLAQLLNGRSLLLLADLLVFLLVRRGLEALPWETSAQEIHKDVTESLQVVSPGLLCHTSTDTSDMAMLNLTGMHDVPRPR